MAGISEAGRLVRAARLSRDLSLEELAARSGVTDRTISDVERGVTAAPRAGTLRRLADALGMSGAERDRLLSAGRSARVGEIDEANESTLPHRLPDFVGREDELERLRALVVASGRLRHSVVVVSGAPGNGKTTLASEWIHRDVPTEARLYVDLLGLHAVPLGPAAVLRTLLHQISGAPQPAATLPALAAQWRSATENRELHVFLDNAASEAQVRPVLSLESSGSVIITSRRPLTGLEGARHLQLEPLPIGDSVRLLSHLIPHDVPADDLAELAKLCDRVPLALRIAGSRLAANPSWRTDDFIAELRIEEHRLRSLVAGDLAVGTAFQLSYDHVPLDERRTFQALSIIDGSTWPVALPAAILDLSPAAMHQGLDELVELGLVQQHSPARYGLHDLLRLYSRARLDENAAPAEIIELERRKRSWLLESTISAGRWFEPSQAPSEGPLRFTTADEARLWLETEVGNWLPAYRDAAASGDLRLTLDVADSLHWFSDIWMHAGIWHEFFGISAEAAERLSDHREMAVHLGYLSWATMTEYRDFTTAASQARRALDSAELSGDVTLEAWSAHYLAEALIRVEDYEGALEAAARAVGLFQAAGNREGLPQALAAEATTQLHLLRLDDAALSCERILRLMQDEATRPPFKIATFTEMSTYDKLARVALKRGDLEKAQAAADSCAAAARLIDHSWGSARAIEIAGEIAMQRNDRDEAMRLLGSANARYVAMGWQRGIDSTNELIASIETTVAPTDD